MTFFVTLSQPVSECHRISIWRVTVSRIETSLSKCRTSFLKTIEHTLQQQNIISVLNSDAPGISFLSNFSKAFSSKKITSTAVRYLVTLSELQMYCTWKFKLTSISAGICFLLERVSDVAFEWITVKLNLSFANSSI